MANHESSRSGKNITEAYPQGIEDGWVELGDHAPPLAGEGILIKGPDGSDVPFINSEAGRQVLLCSQQQARNFTKQARDYRGQ